MRLPIFANFKILRIEDFSNTLHYVRVHLLSSDLLSLSHQIDLDCSIFLSLLSGTTVEFGITVEFPGSSKLEVEGNGTKVEVGSV